MTPRLLNTLILGDINHEKAGMAELPILERRFEKSYQKGELQDDTRAGREVCVIVDRNRVFGERELNMLRIFEGILTLQIAAEKLNYIFFDTRACGQSS